MKMKSYSQKRADRKEKQHKEDAAFAKLSEGRGVRETAVEAFRRPPYQMRKKDDVQD